MVRLNEDALICDLAETYHIFDYRSMPPQLEATLAAGLGDDSRIKRLAGEQPASSEVMLLGGILDALHAIMYRLSDGSSEPPTSIVDMMFGRESGPQKQCMSFESYDDFEAYRQKLISKEVQ